MSQIRGYRPIERDDTEPPAKIPDNPPTCGSGIQPQQHGESGVMYLARLAQNMIDSRDAEIAELRRKVEEQAEAVRALGEELASWRNAPYRSDILETYWADISDTDKHIIRFGLDVNNNQIASKAVKDGE